jgi:hypothetical protein
MKLAVSLVVGVALAAGFFALRERREAPASVPREDVFAARARPVRAPRLVGQPCDRPQNFTAVGLPREFPAEGALGSGPVHPVSRAIPRLLDFFPPRSRRSRWWSTETMWVSEPGYSGPVLVRGRMVHRGTPVGFGDRARPSWELRLPAGRWDEANGAVRIWSRRVVPPNGWRVRRSLTRVLPGSGPGVRCYFFQLDGTRFSQTVMFGVIIEP